MTFLLDTHAFLWFVLDDARLGRAARVLIGDGGNDVPMSPASCWEIAIKLSLGKYHLPGPFGEFMRDQMERNRFSLLPISLAHVDAVARLPFHHRDPFDRLIVAQAITEDMPLLSADATLDLYPVGRIW